MEISNSKFLQAGNNPDSELGKENLKANPVEFIYLSQEEVIAAGGLDMKMAIDAVEKAFVSVSKGETVIPSKIILELPPGEKERGRMNGLAAHIGGDWEVAGIKWIPSFPKNPYVNDLPRANALIILNDTHTGMPLVVMDGTIISAMRTGAVGGVGAKYLARKDSEVAGLIGLGVQSKTQALALAKTLPSLREIRGYRRTTKKAYEDAKEIEELTGVKTVVAENPRDAVQGADVVVTSTCADEPIVKEEWMKKGSLLTHIGSYIEEEYEVVLNSNKIIADDWEVIKHRKTPVLARMFDEGIIKDGDIYANLDEIVASNKKGRETDSERIFFSPIGMPHEDVAFASKVYERAKSKGLGQTLSLWKTPRWV
jgi:N-[(2S)-2-amino-2-carboxyethyl]-L-glutamate dehydrogenase